MWRDPVTLSALVTAVTGLFASAAALITAIRGHVKASNAVATAQEVAAELHNGNGNGVTPD